MKGRNMTEMETIGINVRAPAYMSTQEGVSVPCVALEIGGRTFSGVDTSTVYFLAPDLVEKLLPHLTTALEQIAAIPSALSKGAH
jgi:hypothetical protein